jgi:hypothetical protein
VTSPPSWLIDRLTELDASDAYVVLVVDPCTDQADAYGPYVDGLTALGAADLYRRDFDAAGLSDVRVEITRLHTVATQPSA